MISNDDFVILSDIIISLLNGKDTSALSQKKFQTYLEKAEDENRWFIHDNICMALENIALMLKRDNLDKWLSEYEIHNNSKKPKTIGLIMAGNIPLVGFHDMISILISGNIIKAKVSSKDKVLPEMIKEILCNINLDYSEKIIFTENLLKNFDAIIATGSNNSARIFNEYFSKHPNIIRKNRNSVAILKGNESDEELNGLAHDVFDYFGLGCRNVSKLYVPRGFSFERLIQIFNVYEGYSQHNKYINNYDYQKAILLLNRQNFMDAGFYILYENCELSSPIGIVNYAYYDDSMALNKHLQKNIDNIQVIVSKENSNFGKSQNPQLWDYADGIDTLLFLLNL